MADLLAVFAEFEGEIGASGFALAWPVTDRTEAPRTASNGGAEESPRAGTLPPVSANEDVRVAEDHLMAALFSRHGAAA
jgi:hypothetical protein